MKTVIAALLMLASVQAIAEQAVPAHAYVRFETTEGNIVVELDGRRAPLTVKNFLALVESGYFDGTIFHRVIPGFMIQGGGYTPGLKSKEPEGELANESGNGLRNLRGTIAMARRSDPHTAVAQFYINLADNPSLDPQPDHWGYAVFGVVIEGSDVVDRIAASPTGPAGQFSKDVPIVPIVIKKAVRFEYGS
ncbi:MAG: peptidyl-prolyl cis-trans isomerase [Woeseiaceae bacterium]|nr:peptidyl-prolyl cis-trans isomerase [Woeseiaceae bacterium]